MSCREAHISRLSRLISVLLFTAMLLPRSGLAQPVGDYDWESWDWNGLAALRQSLSTDLGIDLEISSSLDLSSASPTVPVALIYPTFDLPAAELAYFVERGGRLLIADDFGNGRELLHLLGVTSHRDHQPTHQSCYRGNSELPMFSIDPSTSTSPLLSNVGRVVANHPTALSSRSGSVIAYQNPNYYQNINYGLLYDVHYGEGRALVLGDPSLLINFMLDVADNQTLATNLFAALCEGFSECSVRVGAGEWEVVGRLERPEPELGLADSVDLLFSESFSAVNELLERLSGVRLNNDAVFYASVILAFGISVYIFLAVSLVRPRWLSFCFSPPAEMRSRSEFEWQLDRLIQAGADGDYVLPSAILKDEFEELFLGELLSQSNKLAHERRYEPDQVEMIAEQFACRVVVDGSIVEHHQAMERVREVLNELAEIPSRNNLVPEVDARYSERDFRRLYLSIRRLLEELGIWDRYERRTGSP